jgi:FkbM family methyltransferase
MMIPAICHEFLKDATLMNAIRVQFRIEDLHPSFFGSTKSLPVAAHTTESALERLRIIHDKLRFQHGSLEDEFPEQMMVSRFLTGREKVLELRGNVGRNSVVIASILNANHNSAFVVMESDPDTAELLRQNREANGLTFHVEPSALSKHALMQIGWDTMPLDIEQLGGARMCKRVGTMTYAQLVAKYGIQFDTLVVDCEGAFYHILRDMPDILDTVRLVIMENDYPRMEQKHYVDRALRQTGFEVAYSEPGGWGCCRDAFFQVWRRDVG